MRKQPKPIFYGLLYIEEKQKKHVNIRGGGDPLDIYLRCAVLCARSISHYGYSFRLVTNERSRIEGRLQQMGTAQLDIVEQEFALSVPENLQFRAAHFKLELYRKLGSGSFGEHVGVVDIDSVMIAPIHFPLLPSGSILAYDITDQVSEEYGYDRLCLDIKRVSGVHLSECRWFGGEFIFGHAESFQRLAASIFRMWPNYLKYVGQLHHVGDEMLASAAIPSTDLTLIDAGQLGLVARWWTARTNFKQIPFDVASTRSILHLPADKYFLAGYVEMPFCSKDFIRRFRRAARGKLFRRRLFNEAEALLGRRRRYVARLSEH